LGTHTATWQQKLAADFFLIDIIQIKTTYDDLGFRFLTFPARYFSKQPLQEDIEQIPLEQLNTVEQVPIITPWNPY
jgi:hypothetical protein